MQCISNNITHSKTTVTYQAQINKAFQYVYMSARGVIQALIPSLIWYLTQSCRHPFKRILVYIKSNQLSSYWLPNSVWYLRTWLGRGGGGANSHSYTTKSLHQMEVLWQQISQLYYLLTFHLSFVRVKVTSLHSHHNLIEQAGIRLRGVSKEKDVIHE